MGGRTGVRVLSFAVALAAVGCSPARESGAAQGASSRAPSAASPGTTRSLATASPTAAPPSDATGRGPLPQPPRSAAAIKTWVYQLQGYPNGRLDALARAPAHLAVIDLARDAKADFFRPDEIDALRGTGKTVLAYFEIGSIETFRPEYGPLREQTPDLILNRWSDWPDEYFVRYWDPRWWDRVVRPRVDQAIRAGFDGVYLDTPLAYEELDLSMVRGESRDSLARKMVGLISRISSYAKSRRATVWIVPQNSPELRDHPGYIEAIDGIGMEELFFQATDEPCEQDFCTENLDNARALRDAGKLVLAVDYATRPENVRTACNRYRDERFAGYVGVRDLDRISTPCP